jgi:hypothetical protein
MDAKATSKHGRAAAAAASTISKKKTKAASSESSRGADHFPILAGENEEYDDVDTEELLERGSGAQARLKKSQATHGQTPRETVVRGSGIPIADPSVLAPKGKKGAVRVWIERRGGACCACCGGLICRAGIRTKQTVVKLCGCCTLLIAAAAVALLVWLQRRVDAQEKAMGMIVG